MFCFVKAMKSAMIFRLKPTNQGEKKTDVYTQRYCERHQTMNIPRKH